MGGREGRQGNALPLPPETQAGYNTEPYVLLPGEGASLQALPWAANCFLPSLITEGLGAITSQLPSVSRSRCYSLWSLHTRTLYTVPCIILTLKAEKLNCSEVGTRALSDSGVCVLNCLACSLKGRRLEN